jgi:hypothetical protein
MCLLCVFTVVGTGLFIKVYNHIYDKGVISFYAETTISCSALWGQADGAIQLFGGFVMCTILIQAIVWPVKKVSGIKQVL